MLLFAILLLGFLPLLLLFLVNRRKSGGLDQFPEPPANFLIGHILDMHPYTNIFNVMSQHFKNHGKTIQVRIGPRMSRLMHGLITCDYKLTEFVLSSNRILTKSENYKFLKPWLGSGLLISDGQIWKEHRKILTPAFHFEILKQFIGVFEAVGSVFVEKLYQIGESSSVDLYPLVSLCTLDVICETAMNVKMNVQKGENSEYVKCVKEMCRINLERFISLFKVLDCTFALTKDSLIQKKALKVLHGFTKRVIKTRKETLLDRGKGNEITKKTAFLDLLLKYSNGGNLMNDDEIREEVDTFMFEGHDTTANAICYTLFSLANNPEIQEKVLQEQIDLFGTEKNPQITYQDLQNMKYLELVIKESLRLYPIVPFIGRYTTEDIEYDGNIIPKGKNVAICIYLLHRDPEIFPDPEKFDPDRFRNFDSSLPYAYIPFSAGARNCIGQRFAMLEMKSTVSKIMRHFELFAATPKHTLILAPESVLKSVNGIKVGFKKRM